MSKFKEGDKIKRVRHSHTVFNCPIGHETLVEDVRGDDTIGYKNQYGEYSTSSSPEDWELIVPKSPVRTKTVTEIVPGVYGVVEVGKHDEAAGLVLVSMAATTRGFMRNVPELTDAINTLTAIRDALQEQDK